jgi:hypothetical protein
MGAALAAGGRTAIPGRGVQGGTRSSEPAPTIGPGAGDGLGWIGAGCQVVAGVGDGGAAIAGTDRLQPSAAITTSPDPESAQERMESKPFT